jgi:hypothetical protein
MSLNRLYNGQQILDNTSPEYGQLYTDSDLSLLAVENLTPYDPKLIQNNIAEVHLYSSTGDYLGVDIDARYVVLDDVSNTLLINLREVFKLASIDRGAYKTVINILQPIFGSPDDFPAFLKEISPDRTELRIELSPNSVEEAKLKLQQFRDSVQRLSDNDLLNHTVLNFGFNRLVKITNIKFYDNLEGFYVKLYDVLPDDISEKDSLWSAFEVADPYVDSISLFTPHVDRPSNQLAGPNFDIDVDQDTSKATVYKTWDDLLDSDTTTNQRIVDTFVSSSGVTLNIDYTDFNNFVFYGSAEERIKNFKSKLELVEYYDNQISLLSNSSGSNQIVTLQGNLNTYNRRKDNLVSSFTPFEKWLYYEPTGSIFTHGITGSLTPYPKYISGSRQYVHHTTSSIAETWYSSAVVSSSAYDCENQNSLKFMIPDHIRRNPNNSQFELFVDMLSEHYDELYAYVKALTSIYERDEHPQRGTPNELLPAIAESFGWKLQNTKNLSELWLYAAGINQSGSYDVPSGSLVSETHRNLNYQVWRRLVNNLPYLLKNKGTTRSVKALMSVYGIPHTLISFKEYGGPSKETFRPALIKDKYLYKLNFDGEQAVTFPRIPVPPTEGKWGGVERLPDTIEFRFGTTYSASVSMSLYSWDGYQYPIQDIGFMNIELIHSSASFGTWTYSGSNSYGKLELSLRNGSNFVQRVETEHLPLFDGDMWTVQMYTTESVLDPQTVHLRVAKASDCSYGEVVFSSSVTMSSTAGNGFVWGDTANLLGVLGGSTSSNAVFRGGDRFSGSIQGYKEYFEVINEDTFYDHVRNPSAYHGNNPTSSFYTLYRYFPLGIDSRRLDHSTVLSVTSSQPDRSITFYNSASFVGFTGTQATQYTGYREHEYIVTPTIGGNNIINDKVRLEDTTLKHELSPDARAEVARYDFAPVDSKRLAIVFSPTDQINNEIFNHTGFTELDDYIGDPQNQYKSEYPLLKEFSKEYWQKWSENFNINEYLTIFSLYDYTIFDQIKQLIPARADYIGGVLIEPHILERSKVETKRPSRENLSYETEIPNTVVRGQSGQYLTYTSSLITSASLVSSYDYYTSSLVATASLTSSYDYYTASISDVNYFTGSTGCTQSIIDQCRTRCEYKKVIYYYSASNTYYNSEYRRQFAVYVSQSYNWFYSRSLSDTCYQLDECGVQNRSRFAGSKLTGQDFNVDSRETIDGGPVVWFKESNENKINISRDGFEGNLRLS